MSNEDVFCREASVAIGEVLYGTAVSRTEFWIAVEVADPWGPKGVEDSGLDPNIVNLLDEIGRGLPGVRAQLIRKPERPRGGCVVYLGRSREHGAEVFRGALGRVDEILKLDLKGFVLGQNDLGFLKVEEPVYLVCVHGKRDRCCAQHGMPLYTALNALSPEHTWQTTHLGGHRFAATMVVLPQGIAYGRVTSDEAPAIVRAHTKGLLHDLERLRGRTCYSPAAQAAEYLLRKGSGGLGLDDLTLIGQFDEAGHSRVTFRDASGAEHSVLVAKQTLAATPASCGAPPKPVDRFVELRRSSTQLDN